MKFKKGSLTDILSFVLIFTLFFGLMVAYLFNNITQERRSVLIDELNKQAMVLQTKLEGYSNTYNFCNMYKDGVKIQSASEIEREKNRAIQETKDSIKAFFEDSRNASLLELRDISDIDIVITDGPNVKDFATVKITVKYYAAFKSPYAKNDGGDGTTASKLKLRLSDSASRVIENPIRQRNTKS